VTLTGTTAITLYFNHELTPVGCLNCETLFEEYTLLGTGPICTITSNQIVIILGTGATIVINDYLTIKPGVLSSIGCPMALTFDAFRRIKAVNAAYIADVEPKYLDYNYVPGSTLTFVV
jgi:hypothetical protein